MRRAVFLLAVFLFAGTAGADILRVATWNVRNYLVQGRQVEGRWFSEYPKPESEKQALRLVLREINPDILALQEMGPPEFLVELQRDLAEEGLDYPHAIWMEAEDLNRHLAVLSQVEPSEVIHHTDMDFPYFSERLGVKRGLLEVVFPDGNGGSWSLFVVHLKSRWTTDQRDPSSYERRTKEAEAARDRILERFPEADAAFLVVGDLNDHPGSGAFRRFESRGDRAITKPVDAVDGRGEKWTHYYAKIDRYDRVDFILTSLAMEQSLVPGSARVADMPAVLQASDHRPLFVDINLLKLRAVDRETDAD